jgi:drug/metabolite transporter (DMT)-like permease
MNYVAEQRMKAAALVVTAVGIASAQDAIVKSMAGGFPAYEVMMVRGAIGAPILLAWLAMKDSLATLRTPLFWPLVLRGLVLASAYFAFILSIAAMPIANSVAIYFTMPFFVAALAGPFLGEHVPIYRWLAMVAGFVGVIIMVNPQARDFEPASFLALYSALGYAVGQMMGRHYAQRVPPIAIANIQNGVYFLAGVFFFILFNATGLQLTGHKSLEFLSRAAVWPSLYEFSLLALMGLFAAVGSVLFTNAYKYGQSSFVAPFEYTAMIWAVFYGLVLFGDFPTEKVWLGMAIVVGAGLFMTWRDAKARFSPP